jgi:hypothetical protein
MMPLHRKIVVWEIDNVEPEAEWQWKVKSR